MESKNIALQGTLCINGSGLGICVGMGGNTVFGQIAKESTGNRPMRTALEIEITRFLLIVAAMAISVAVLIISKH